jgi:quinol monooxygenase YgiN
MAESSLRAVDRIKAKPEGVKAVGELLSGLVEPTRKESGCVSYQLLQNRRDPTDFTFAEEWQSDAAFEAHLSSAHVQQALPKLEAITAEPPDIRTTRSYAERPRSQPENAWH